MPGRLLQGLLPQAGLQPSNRLQTEAPGPKGLQSSRSNCCAIIKSCRHAVHGTVLAPAELLSSPARSLQDYGNNIVCSSSLSGGGSREGSSGSDAQAAPSAGKATRLQGSTGHSVSSAAPAPDEISSAEAARRQKISQKMQQRWQCRTRDLRTSVQTKMKGKVPWNKGRQMSEETRERMRAAKLATRHSAATRARMSRSHIGLPQTAAKSAALSTALQQLPKGQRHKEAIATSQRRRLAAHRVLQAIESVHRHCDVPALAGAVSTAHTSSAPLLGLTATPKNQSRAQVLEHFQALLHEFRSLQHELGPWTTAFTEQHKRKPRMTDVEQTGIPWLESKYKQYVLMRERVLTETQNLRDKLLNAVPEPQQPQQRGEYLGDKMNANRAVTSSMMAANRLATALAYKSAKITQSSPTAPLPPSPAGLPSTSPTFSQPPRVRTALMAAAEYRRRKAEETAATAQSAGDKARAPPVRSRARALADAAAKAPGAATLIKGMKFEGHEAGQARREVQTNNDIEREAVERLAAELDASVRELIQAELPLAPTAA